MTENVTSRNICLDILASHNLNASHNKQSVQRTMAITCSIDSFISHFHDYIINRILYKHKSHKSFVILEREKERFGSNNKSIINFAR